MRQRNMGTKQIKYAVKVHLFQDEWMFITEDRGKCDFELTPSTFNTRVEAETYATTFNRPGNKLCKVVALD